MIISFNQLTGNRADMITHYSFVGMSSLHFTFLPPMSSDTPASVPLPRAFAGVGSTRNKPPLWAIDASGPSVQTPLPAKCSRHTREGEVCCQELRGEDERQLVDPDIIRDM